MTAKKIYVCYDYDHDQTLRDQVLAWELPGDDFVFIVDERAPGVYTSAGQTVGDHLEEADCVLCLVGKMTYRNRVVGWELRKARELEKKIVAVKTEISNPSPQALIGANEKWAIDFSTESVLRTLEDMLI